jgi:hypothetical protein
MGINFVDRCRSISKEGDHVVPRSSVMKSLKSKVQWDPDALPCIVMLLNKQAHSLLGPLIPSRSGWHCPVGLVVQYRCLGYCYISSYTSIPTCSFKSFLVRSR